MKKKQIVRSDTGAYIDGVPPIRLGECYECSYSGCLMLMLNAVGVNATYEQLTGVSGSCYRASMCYGWDFGSNIVNTSYCSLGITAENNAPLAFGMECYDPTDESTRDAQVCDSIDSGIPVLVLDGRGEPEWSIILGYERSDNGVKFFGRSYFDADAPADECFTDNQYTLMDHYPGCGPKLYRSCEPTSPLDALKCSLETCLAMFQPHEKFGYGAYNKMIESFENNHFKSDWNSEGNIDAILITLTDARRAAYMYLNENAELLNGENKKRMLLTASLYQEMFRTLESIIHDEDFNHSAIQQCEQTRKRFADRLRKCVELEQKAHDFVQELLSNWQSNKDYKAAETDKA